MKTINSFSRKHFCFKYSLSFKTTYKITFQKLQIYKLLKNTETRTLKINT